MGLFELRPRQLAAIESLRASLRAGKKRPIIQAPVGYGKTIIAAHIASGARAKGKRVAFTAPSISLIDQNFDRFVQNGIEPGDMGVLQGQHPWHRPFAPIQIASVQTIGSRGFPEVDIAIIDECHVKSQVISEWKIARPNTIFVGLSATPFAKGMAEEWDDLIIPATLQELIDEGWCSPFKAYAPYHPDLSGIATVAGDYHQGQLSERLRKPTIVGDVVGTWLEKADYRPTLVFAVDRAHAAQIHDQFGHEGVDSAYVDAETPREERLELGKKLNDGRLSVICSVGTMTQGVDLDIRCVVLARPTKSEILLVQMVGRGLRIAPGKSELLILDHSDSLLNLGLPTDIKHDRLRGGKAGPIAEMERKPPKPRECRQCKALIPPAIRACLECGYDPVPECNVTTAPGMLVDFDKAVLEKRTKRKENQEWDYSEKEGFYAELRGYAIERGYKDGWAAQKYKSKFGVWPDDPRVKYARPRNCGPAVRSWIRSSMIAWAKSKAKTESALHA